VLWVDWGNGRVATIDLKGKTTGVPVWRSIADIEVGIQSGTARVVDDIYANKLSLPESQIPDKDRLVRDTRWDAIALLVEVHDESLFHPGERGRLIREIAKKTGYSRKDIYKWLRFYWQRGQRKNALLPDFHNCGIGERRVGELKRGRKSKVALATGVPTGINVDKRIYGLIMQGVKEFYLKPHHPSMRRAYELMLEAYFYDRHELCNGVLVPVLLPESERPTLDQFRYYAEKAVSLPQRLQKREGGRAFRLRHRAVLGDSTHMAYGPGSAYQIDATVGDIYLVSSLDRKRIIGRPVIYFVIDVFSRLITGFSVSLEGPSWIGAMVAIENAVTDKVSFCAAYGIPISKEAWPAQHLPSVIIADRGEMEGYSADNLVNGLGIQVSNAPAYRPDLKGIVERNFRLTNDKLIRWLPGAVYDISERGGPDYRIDARLTLFEFRQLIIYLVLHHNRTHRMDSYPMTEDMISDGVEPYPNLLWQWGIENRSGRLRAMDRETVRLNLLPLEKNGAVVTRSGIEFRKLHYTCAEAEQEQWFAIARNSGRQRVDVIHDPRNTSTIYLVLGSRQKLLACQILEKDRTFLQRDWYDVLQHFELVSIRSQIARSSDLQSGAEYRAQIDAIVESAEKLRDTTAPSESDRSRVLGITENRALERDMERGKMAWQPGSRTEGGQSENDTNPLTQSLVPGSASGYVPPPNFTDLIDESIRSEKENG
jgi:putative transposase